MVINFLKQFFDPLGCGGPISTDQSLKKVFYWKHWGPKLEIRWNHTDSTSLQWNRIPRNSPSEFAWKNLRQRRFGMFETLQPIFACLPSFRVYRACSTESVFKIIDIFTNDPEPSFSVSLQPGTSICKQPSEMQEKRVERAVCVFGLWALLPRH